MTDLLKRMAVFTGVLMVLTALGCATLQDTGLDDILPEGEAGLNEATVAAGLREALTVGTDRTVTRVTAEDGYIGNPDIRIRPPQQWASAVRTMRSVGLGSYVDEIEMAMNRAAEQAAAEAVPVFVDAITAMTIKDAFAILEGDDTAATAYFRDKTGKELKRRYGPIVEARMAELGLVRAYDKARARYEALPMTQHIPAVDLDDYVVDAALDGLFTVLAEEEQRIREDPAARTTALLVRVFGGE